MFNKLPYFKLLVVVFVFLLSCTNHQHKPDQFYGKQKQNRVCRNKNEGYDLPLVKRKSVLPGGTKRAYLNFTETTPRKPAVDTMNLLKIGDVQGKAGVNVLLPQEKVKKQVMGCNIPVMLSVRFDNDIFDNTDYYYTNGIRLALYTDIAGLSPLDKVLITPPADIELKGFFVTQNMYTPTIPETETILYGDYPFSGFLTVGQFSESYHLDKKLVVKSSIEFGVLGPASLSGSVQASVHKEMPSGWKYQIANSPVINYSVWVEKGIISNGYFEWNAVLRGHVGTLFDNIETGTFIRIGNFTPVVRGPRFLTCFGKQKKHLQYWFFLKGGLQFTAYNATLQGSMFNNNSPYTVSSSDISRVVAKASAGIALYYGSLGVEFENFYNSPEFRGAYDFRYGRISLLFGF